MRIGFLYNYRGVSSELKEKNKKTQMQKEIKRKDDGRYIIFYNFTKQKEN